MTDRYKLKTGQINFESTDNPGAYQCVVIKDGEFHNLTDELKKILIQKLQSPVRAVLTEDAKRTQEKSPQVTSAEDMF